MSSSHGSSHTSSNNSNESYSNPQEISQLLGKNQLGQQKICSEKQAFYKNRFSFSSQIKVLNKVSFDLQQHKDTRNNFKPLFIDNKKNSTPNLSISTGSFTNKKERCEALSLSIKNSQNSQNISQISGFGMSQQQNKLSNNIAQSNFKHPFKKQPFWTPIQTPCASKLNRNIDSITTEVKTQNQDNKQLIPLISLNSGSQSCQTFIKNDIVFEDDVDLIGKRGHLCELKKLNTQVKGEENFEDQTQKLIKIESRPDYNCFSKNPILTGNSICDDVKNNTKVPEKEQQSYTQVNTPNNINHCKNIVNTTGQKFDCQSPDYTPNNTGINTKNITTPDSLKIDPYLASVNRLKHFIDETKNQANMLISKLPETQKNGAKDSTKIKKKERLQFLFKM